jgi:hypothetical protein
VAAEVAPGSVSYWKIREAVRNAVRPKVEAKVREVYGDRLDENLVSALGLLDRMLPSEPLVAPKVDHAEILFPMDVAA